LRYAYFIKCLGVGQDSNGQEVLRCTYDPETRGGYAPDGRKVRGTIHWVSARHALPATVRLYENLFSVEHPENVPEGSDYKHGLQVVEKRSDSWVEPSLAGAVSGAVYQFERRGYFCVDPDSTGGNLVFNRTVGLRDTWVKILKKQGRQ
ncbi:MAG: glutamine--tRNA ligase, partial [Acidobacteria bacterium]|nr:glutamine--tRNA ligase [Acidobacteriota bacterium]